MPHIASCTSLLILFIIPSEGLDKGCFFFLKHRKSCGRISFLCDVTIWPPSWTSVTYGMRSFTWRYLTSCSATILSMTFDMNVKLETGRWFFGSPASSDGLFSSGVMMARFWEAGRQPSRSKAFTIAVTKCTSVLRPRLHRPLFSVSSRALSRSMPGWAATG